jgi:membrane protease YdiL (CAAX protease family)
MGSSHAEKLAPRTRSQLAWWVALSISAGFCEEFIFRGYLMWVFQPVLGLWGSAAFSVVLFATAHAYQGARGVLTTGAIGAALTLIVLISGSLWPSIALHILADVGQGVVACRALQKADAGGEESPALAASMAGR